jgi:TolA-binding protein
VASAALLANAVAATALALLVAAAPAHAQWFPDNEARRAIIDLRNQVAADNERLRAQLAELTRANAALIEQSQQQLQQQQQLRRSLIDLSAEIEQLRADLARLRGSDEQLARDLAELQRRQTDFAQTVEERLRRFEPQRVSVDGREFLADPAEQRYYERAMATLRGGDFAAAASWPPSCSATRAAATPTACASGSAMRSTAGATMRRRSSRCASLSPLRRSTRGCPRRCWRSPMRRSRPATRAARARR